MPVGSQSPIFPYDRRCRCESLNASETGKSTKSPWVGVAINPTTPSQGHFVLSPVSLASRDLLEISKDQGDGPLELNDRQLRSHEKIGDCEQSNFFQFSSSNYRNS